MTVNHQKIQRDRKESSLEPLEAAWCCGYLDVRILASRTMREYISIVVSHLVGSNLHAANKFIF